MSPYITTTREPAITGRYLILSPKWFHTWVEGEVVPKAEGSITISRSVEAFGVSWRLASVVIHHGRNQNSGHYTTLSRRNGDWVEFNDRSARRVPESDLDKYTTHSVQQIGELGFGPKSTAYLLIYEKVLNGDQAVVEID